MRVTRWATDLHGRRLQLAEHGAVGGVEPLEIVHALHLNGGAQGGVQQEPGLGEGRGKAGGGMENGERGMNMRERESEGKSGRRKCKGIK